MEDNVMVNFTIFSSTCKQTKQMKNVSTTLKIMSFRTENVVYLCQLKEFIHFAERTKKENIAVNLALTHQGGVLVS